MADAKEPETKYPAPIDCRTPIELRSPTWMSLHKGSMAATGLAFPAKFSPRPLTAADPGGTGEAWTGQLHTSRPG